MMSINTECKKYGGRTKGTPNKKTKELQEFFESVDFHVPSKIMELLPGLSEERQVDALLRLMGYIYPKRKALEVQATAETYNLHLEIVNEIEKLKLES